MTDLGQARDGNRGHGGPSFHLQVNTMQITLSLAAFITLCWFAFWGVVSGAVSLVICVRDFWRRKHEKADS